MKKLIVFNAGLSTPSTTRMLAEEITGAVEAQVSKRGDGLETTYLDLRDYATDLAAMMTTGIPSPALKDAHDRISAADGLVAATPVFTASYSGLFKMFMDTLDTDSLNGMPVLIAATAGTPRHALVLDFAVRPLFTYLRATVMPTGIFAATQDFGAQTDLTRRINRAASELAGYLVRESGVVEGFGPDLGDSPHSPHSAHSPHTTRTSGTTVDANVTDFSVLLQGHDGS